MQAFTPENADTALINRQIKEAQTDVRRNPDGSLILAYQALSSSKKINYTQGIADASLALGLAYLAKYNMSDSALLYSMKAYDLYTSLNNNVGIARSSYALAYVFSFKGDLTESERYSNLSLSYFGKAGNLQGITNSYNALSYLSLRQKNFERARLYGEKAIETARLAKDTVLMADVTNSLGNTFKDMALFSQAIDTYFEALRLWEQKKDSGGIALAYGNIGLIYYYQKDYDKAMEFSLKKLPISLAKKDLWEVSKTYNNIAQIYNSTKRYDSALVYLRKYLRLNTSMDYALGVAEACHNIATTLLLTSQVDSAYWYINRAVNISKKINDPNLVGYYVSLANIYQTMGKYGLALQYALNAFAMGKEKHLPLIISDASLLISEIYSKINREDLAYRYLKEYQQLKDSISNVEFLKQISRMEMQYDFDKKQEAAEYARMQERMIRDNKIRQQGLYLKGLLILFVGLAILSILYLRHQKLRAKYTQIDLEQRLLRAQMNPHFIFNSLCAVQDFILSNKPQKANAFLTKIARLMRNILENSREEFVALDKEIETLKLYLDVQQLRFETGFDYEIVVDEAIDPENISIPPMLAQPCVENSIEHGLLPSGEKGKVNIIYSLKEDLIMMEIIDNGVGRQQASTIPPGKMKKQSISTHLIEKRLEHFRKILKQRDISYEIIDLYEDISPSGTKVIMMLPFRKIFA